MSASSPAPRRRRRPSPERKQIHHAAGNQPEDASDRSSSTNPWWLESSMSTGQGMETPLSGSHLGPHTRPLCPCNKAVCREAVCSFVTPFNAACSFTNSESASRSSTTKNHFSLTMWGVPVKGASVPQVNDGSDFVRLFGQAGQPLATLNQDT